MKTFTVMLNKQEKFDFKIPGRF